MSYSLYELVWLFFVYSFVGWCLEVSVAAVKRHKFVNMGFVNSPLCPVYGTGAVMISIFLPELKGRLVFLFVGGMIIASLVEYVTGRLLERVFHRRWWDYSEERFHLDGYISLKSSLVWGAGSVLMIYFVNPFLCSVVGLIPPLIGKIVLWIDAVLLMIDFTGSGVAVLGLKKKDRRISQITEELRKTSTILENALTRSIQRRMVNSFPNLEAQWEAEKARSLEGRFAEGCGFYKLASLFFIGAFLGDIVETVFCFVTSGTLMSRSSLIYGQFSIVWGLGCALLTWILYKYKDKSDRYIFLFGTVLGGAYEYMCSVFTEILFGTVFWDYSKMPFNLGGRINLLYCFFWGIAAVVWMKLIYPLLSERIERIPKRIGEIVCICLVLFIIGDMAISGLALARYSERQSAEAQESLRNGEQETGALDRFLDEHYPDTLIEKRYENLKLVD